MVWREFFYSTNILFSSLICQLLESGEDDIKVEEVLLSLVILQDMQEIIQWYKKQDKGLGCRNDKDVHTSIHYHIGKH
jgi:hypothetical protein